MTNLFSSLKDSNHFDREDVMSGREMQVDQDSDVDLHDKLDAQLQRMKNKFAKEREVVVKVCFVLDRIPSYILVISRKLKVDQKFVYESDEDQKIQGNVIFRIISLQVTSKTLAMSWTPYQRSARMMIGLIHMGTLESAKRTKQINKQPQSPKKLLTKARILVMLVDVFQHQITIQTISIEEKKTSKSQLTRLIRKEIVDPI